jgi:hypothetical protein
MGSLGDLNLVGVRSRRFGVMAMFTPPTYDGPPGSRLGRHRLRIPMDSFPKRTLPVNDAIRTGLWLAAAPGSPQVQTLPSSRLALHTCRAHMGVWQSMQRQRQWLGVRPHNPPPSLTWGHWGPTCCAGWRLTILAREGLVTPSRRVPGAMGILGENGIGDLQCNLPLPCAREMHACSTPPPPPTHPPPRGGVGGYFGSNFAKSTMDV